MSYDYRSYSGHASDPHGVWGVLLVGMLIGALLGVCIWAAVA